MDPKKVQTIINWITPSTICDVQYFLGFANFYRIFIEHYSKIAAPLIKLTRKNKFKWTNEVEDAFKSLKVVFITTSILIHVDLTKSFYLEIDASNYALRAVLSQYGNDSHLHPIAFYSRKFSQAKINYEICDKELLAIVASFEIW